MKLPICLLLLVFVMVKPRAFARASYCHWVHRSPSDVLPVRPADLLIHPGLRKIGMREFRKHYGDRYDEFAQTFYSEFPFSRNKGLQFLKAIRLLHPQLEELVYEPGIVLRLDQFIRFIREHPGLGPYEALNLFKEHLGTRRFYRALALDPESALALQTRPGPLLSKSLFQKLGRNEPLKVVAYSLNEDMKKQVSKANGEFLLSISAIPEVSIAVAQQVLAQEPSQNKSIYLIAIDVPVLDTLPLDSLDYYGPANISLINKATGAMKQLKYDESLESFLLFGIETGEILEVQKVEGSYELRF